ncbi:MAG TPA: hypothetical protein VMH34_07085 [Gammaproteobacteria bacterium]|nr:hypothetical protein [Gammaproteobacteria bacterium]
MGHSNLGILTLEMLALGLPWLFAIVGAIVVEILAMGWHGLKKAYSGCLPQRNRFSAGWSSRLLQSSCGKGMKYGSPCR